MNNNKQGWLIFAYLLLLLVAIPWYWPAHDESRIFGIPLWVAAALLVGFCASVLTAWNLRRGDSSDDSDYDPHS